MSGKGSCPDGLTPAASEIDRLSVAPAVFDTIARAAKFLAATLASYALLERNQIPGPPLDHNAAKSIGL
jgi:hypothetical protein